MGTALVLALSIPLTKTTFLILGPILLILSIIALVSGTLPAHNEGTGWGNALRYVAWPLLGLWLVGFLIRGFIV